MKGLARDILSAVLIITLTALVLLALVGTAGAVKLPYQSFDNLHVGDCQYETDANLVLAQWPKAKITTSEVVHAWSTYGSAFEGQDVTSDGGQNWTLSGLWAGQNYLVDVGFAGHRAQSITELGTFSTSSPVTPTEQAALIAAADTFAKNHRTRRAGCNGACAGRSDAAEFLCHARRKTRRRRSAGWFAGDGLGRGCDVAVRRAGGHRH